ncbi:membrane protein [Spirochaetia bacterium]|nr:membrane protein [Spirochaetia bacterium]
MIRQKKPTEETVLKISFQAKETIECPVCSTEFHREELLSGSGRLIAGGLTDELHRLYEPSAKYGRLYPLAYIATVCPNCWFASMEADFLKIPEIKLDKAIKEEDARRTEANMIREGVNFYNSRDLSAGIISQFLVLRCYDYYTPNFSPTIKQALAAMRTGWLLDDLNEIEKGQNYDWLAVLFKKKARFFYNQALKKEQTGKEALSALTNLGPDTDKNYGYEGLLYMNGLLEFKYGDTNDAEKRKENLSDAKRTLAKMFGMGKSSKSKPGPLMEKSRALYDEFSKALGEIDDG